MDFVRRPSLGIGQRFIAIGYSGRVVDVGGGGRPPGAFAIEKCTEGSKGGEEGRRRKFKADVPTSTYVCIMYMFAVRTAHKR